MTDAVGARTGGSCFTCYPACKREKLGEHKENLTLSYLHLYLEAEPQDCGLEG